MGNLRRAYRLGQRQTYTAGLEPADHERQLFDSLSVSDPIAQPVGTSQAHTGSYVARLNAGGSAPQPLGPLTQLAVQQGDTVTVTAHGLYPQAVRNNFWFSLVSFVSNLLHPAAGSAPGPDPRRGRPGLPLLQVGVATGVPALAQLSGGVPKGYLRVLVFDRDSALVSQQTEQLQRTALNNYDSLRLRVLVPQDGYVTAYVGNESEVDVYFDDIRLVHGQGVQVQETHYDPTGLELAGLSGTTPGLKRLSQYKFNGKEFQPDLGLNWNHQDWRFIDLARGPVWHGVDPEIENGQESMSPYVYNVDNAVRFNDPDGRYPGEGGPPSAAGILLNTVVGIGVSAVNAVLGAGDAFGPGGYGLAMATGNSVRATNNGDGSVSYGHRSVPSSGGEVAANTGADVLDVASTALTVVTAGSAGAASRGLPMGAGLLFEQGGAKVVQNKAVEEGKVVLKQFSGTAPRMTKGATPNSIYTQLNSKTGRAQNNYIYNGNGDLAGEVNFAAHGEGTSSGHGHRMTIPGDPSSGHGKGKHIHHDDVPKEWQLLPSGILPSVEIGKKK